MPAHRSLRRAGCPQPKYTFSDDEDEFTVPSDDLSAYTPLPTPPPSATPPSRSTHTRKRPPWHVRRPRNAFIIFRSEFCDRQKMSETGVETDHRHISRIAAHVWNNLDEDNKQVYKERAELEKDAHRVANPTYRYAPTGKPKATSIKRKIKRDGKEDELRCRRLAELIISGVEGEAFQQAAKGLDDGVVEVPLTQRTSQAAPKRPGRARRRPTRVPAVKRNASVEVQIKKESPPPPSELGLLSPFPSPSSPDVLDGESDPKSQAQKPPGTPTLYFPPIHWNSEPFSDVDSSFELAAYRDPVDDFTPLPSLSDAEPDLAHQHLRPGADSRLTLAELCAPKHRPLSPSTPRPLSLDEQNDATFLCPPASTSAPPSLSTPRLPSAPARYPGRSPPPGVLTSMAMSPWKAGADTGVFLAREVEELTLCYPDDPDDDDGMDFEEFLTGW